MATQIVPYGAGGAVGYLGGMNRTPGQVAKIAQQVEAGTRNAGVAEKIVADALAKKTGLRANAGSLAGGLGGILTGIYTRERIAPMVPESAQPYVVATGNAETGAGIGMLGATLKGMSPKFDIGDINTIQSAAADARAKGLVPPEPEVPQEPAKKIANSLRLTNAAREAGAAGKLTKAGAAEFLNSFDLEAATPSQRVAIANALGVKSGNNFIPRMRDKIGSLATKPGASAIIGALIGGGLAADASRSSVQAATGEEAGGAPSVADTATGAALGGAAGYGGNKLADILGQYAPKVKQVAGNVLNTGGAALTPLTLDALSSPTNEEIEQGRRWHARNLPDWTQNEYIRQAGQREMTEQAMAPERQAMRETAQFAPDTEAQLQRLLDSGADQGQIATFLRNLLAPQHGAQLR